MVLSPQQVLQGSLPRLQSTERLQPAEVEYPADFQTYTPEQDQSFFNSIGNMSLSGLAAIGNFLDLPGSMVRDVASWGAGNYANPFDQLLTPLSHVNRTTGRDLTTMYGITDPNTGRNARRWDAGDFIGFGAEVALDPFTWPAKWLKPFGAFKGVPDEILKTRSVGGQALAGGANLAYKYSPRPVKTIFDGIQKFGQNAYGGMLDPDGGGLFDPAERAAFKAIRKAMEEGMPEQLAQQATVFQEFGNIRNAMGGGDSRSVTRRFLEDGLDDPIESLSAHEQDIMDIVRQQRPVADDADVWNLARERRAAELDQTLFQRQHLDNLATRDQITAIRRAAREGQDLTDIPNIRMDELLEDARRVAPIDWDDQTIAEYFAATQRDRDAIWSRPREDQLRMARDEIESQPVYGGDGPGRPLSQDEIDYDDMSFNVDEFEDDGFGAPSEDTLALQAGRAVEIRDSRLARMVEDTENLIEGVDAFPEGTTGFLAQVGTRESKVLVRRGDTLQYRMVPNSKLFPNEDAVTQAARMEDFFEKFASDVAYAGQEATKTSNNSFVDSFMKLGEVRAHLDDITLQDFAERNQSVIDAIKDVTGVQNVFPEDGAHAAFSEAVGRLFDERGEELLAGINIPEGADMAQFVERAKVGVLGIWEARARQWSEASGRSADEFFDQYAPGIRNTARADFESGRGNDILMQGKNLKFTKYADDGPLAIEVTDNGQYVGEVALNRQTPHQENYVRDMFSIPEGEPIQRIAGIHVEGSHRGKKLGKRLYMELADQADGWIWNNQASEDAIRTLDSLERDGLMEVKWRKPDNRVQDQHRVMRITEKGRRELNKARDGGSDVLYQAGVRTATEDRGLQIIVNEDHIPEYNFVGNQIGTAPPRNVQVQAYVDGEIQSRFIETPNERSLRQSIDVMDHNGDSLDTFIFERNRYSGDYQADPEKFQQAALGFGDEGEEYAADVMAAFFRSNPGAEVTFGVVDSGFAEKFKKALKKNGGHRFHTKVTSNAGDGTSLLFVVDTQNPYLTGRLRRKAMESMAEGDIPFAPIDDLPEDEVFNVFKNVESYDSFINGLDIDQRVDLAIRVVDSEVDRFVEKLAAASNMNPETISRTAQSSVDELAGIVDSVGDSNLQAEYRRVIEASNQALRAQLASAGLRDSMDMLEGSTNALKILRAVEEPSKQAGRQLAESGNYMRTLEEGMDALDRQSKIMQDMGLLGKGDVLYQGGQRANTFGDVSKSASQTLDQLEGDIASFQDLLEGEMDRTFHANTIIQRMIRPWKYGGIRRSVKMGEKAYAGAWESFKEAMADVTASVPYSPRSSAKTGLSQDPIDAMRDAFPGGKVYKDDDILIPLRRAYQIQKSAFGEGGERNFENFLELLIAEDTWNMDLPEVRQWLDDIKEIPEARQRGVQVVQALEGDPEYMLSGLKEIDGQEVLNENYIFDPTDSEKGLGHLLEVDPGDGSSKFYTKIGDELTPYQGKSWEDAYDAAYNGLMDKVNPIVREGIPARQAFDDLFGKDAGPLFQQGTNTGAERAAVEFAQDGTAMMHLFENADLTSFLHESAHIFRRSISDLGDELTTQMDDAIGSLLGDVPTIDPRTGNWSREAEEAFATGFEEYVRSGKAPNVALRSTFEKFKEWVTDIYRRVRAFWDGESPTAEVNPELKAVFDNMLSTTDEMIDTKTVAAKTGRVKNNLYAKIEETGVPVGWHVAARDMADEGFQTDHWPRYVPAKLAKEFGDLGITPSDINTGFASLKARRADIRDMPNDLIERLLVDKSIRRGSPEEVAARLIEDPEVRPYLREDYGRRPDAEVDTDSIEAGGVQASGEGIEAHAADLAKFLSGKNRATLFRYTMRDAMDRYVKGANRTIQSATGLHNFINGESTLRRGGIKASDIYDRLGFDTEKVRDFYQTKFQRDLDSVLIDRNTARAALKFKQIMNPEQADHWIGKKLLDPINKLFKTNVTIPFPSFHGRNFISGQAVNAVFELGVNPKNYARYRNSFAEAMQKLGTQDPEFFDELYRYGVLKKDNFGQGMSADDFIDVGGNATSDPRHIAPPNSFLQNFAPLRNRAGVRQSVMDAEPQIFESMMESGGPGIANAYQSAIGSRAGRSVRTTAEQVYKSGENMGRYMEYYNRVPLYLYVKDKLVRGGMDVHQAAIEANKRTQELHFDYSKLSPFEKKFMKRVMPFYTFTRKMTGLLLDELATRPGGLMAQTIRASRLGQSDDAATPEYVAQTASIPLGMLDSGANRYLTGTGMAWEDPVSFLSADKKTGMPNFGDMFAEGISRTSPIIKAPIELAAGESFFQRGPMGGRELVDMDPTLGRLVSNVSELTTGQPREMADGRAVPVGGQGFEHVLANLPTARAVSTLRGLTDKRKYEGGNPLPAALNFFTGLRISDISPNAQLAILRERVGAHARQGMGARSFNKIYFSREEVAETAKKDPELARQKDAINRMRQIFEKRREEQRQSSP